jgi:hypothetical protein
VGARALLAGALSLAVLAAGAPSVSARTITGGTITVGRGADGVTLGMTRAQTIHRLGRPVAENQNGVMSYGGAQNIFDIYRKFTRRVRQFVIAQGSFRLSDGNRIFAPGGLRRLKRRYGQRLKFHTFEDGSPYYEVVTHLNGRKVLNDFETDRRSIRTGRVLDVFILFA